MKKSLIAIGLFIVGCAPVGAYSIGEFLTQVDQQVKFTLLEDVTAAYFYDGQVGRSEVGVISHAVTINKYFYGDVGMISPYEDKDRGGIVYGASLDGGKVLGDIFPNQVATVKAFLPTTVNSIFEKLFIGPYIGRDTTRSQLVGGFYSGISFKFW